MCFSATASFTVAAALTPVGAYCVYRASAQAPRSMLFALFPLLFALQQVIEGFVWLDLPEHLASPGPPVFGFLFFSHFLWLWWVPLAAWYLQPAGAAKTLCGCLALLGFLYGLSLFAPLVAADNAVQVAVAEHSVSYRVDLIYAGILSREWVHGFYALCVISPLLIQSDFHVRVFGGIVLFSMLIASREFTQAYISVWCFFAAVASAYLLFMLPRHARVQILTA